MVLAVCSMSTSWRVQTAGQRDVLSFTLILLMPLAKLLVSTYTHYLSCFMFVQLVKFVKAIVDLVLSLLCYKDVLSAPDHIPWHLTEC